MSGPKARARLTPRLKPGACAALSVNRAGAIYRAADPGHRWKAWAVTPSGTTTVAFASPAVGVALALSPNGRWSLDVTRDGGRTWASQSLTGLTGTSEIEVPAISATASGALWLALRACVPGDGCTGQVLMSTNLGQSWRRTNVGSAVTGGGENPPGFSVRGVSGRTAWLIVPGRLPYHTADGGRTWTLP